MKKARKHKCPICDKKGNWKREICSACASKIPKRKIKYKPWKNYQKIKMVDL